jgi:hypothetical protein
VDTGRWQSVKTLLVKTIENQNSWMMMDIHPSSSPKDIILGKL